MTGQQQVRAAGVAQLIGVLALLLGLLAMHGLVSGHHTPTAAVAQQPTTATAVADGENRTAQGDHAAPAAHTGVSGLLASPSNGALRAAGCVDCPDHAMAMLCLAVLSAGLALLLARRARTGGLPAPELPLPMLRAGPPLRLRPPDLVSQLCVSRT